MTVVPYEDVGSFPRPLLLPPNATHWINFPLFTLYVSYSITKKDSKCWLDSLSPPAALAFPGGSFHVVYRDHHLCYHLAEQMCHNNFLVGGKICGGFGEGGISVEKSNTGFQMLFLAQCRGQSDMLESSNTRTNSHHTSGCQYFLSTFYARRKYLFYLQNIYFQIRK